MKPARPLRHFHHSNKWAQDKAYTATADLTSHQLCSPSVSLIPPPIDVFLVLYLCRLEAILRWQEARPRKARENSLQEHTYLRLFLFLLS